MPVKAKPELADLHHPNLGRGLFPDPRAKASAFRTYFALLRVLRKWSGQHPKLNWRDAKVHVRAGLIEVARSYWADHDHERRVASHNIKANIKKLSGPLKTVSKLMNKLPYESRQALNLEYARLNKRLEVNIEDIASKSLINNEALLAAVTAVSHRKYAKGSSTRVKKACSRLWTIWENISARQFVRRYETAELPLVRGRKRPEEEFVSLDAQFVYISVRGIDPQVTLAQVRAALRAVAKEKPKPK